ncbi:hypothetical protein FHS27_004856 [Rhodopirellula rubra]|uniref:Uncharacterized protein n=1 Tax=Aporhodopirellula rubra TaxID=980271 RepID=A0A7W5H8F7_9BACT|nr:hypothetical protein [Aporhodopirellula rubra]
MLQSLQELRFPPCTTICDAKKGLDAKRRAWFGGMLGVAVGKESDAILRRSFVFASTFSPFCRVVRRLAGHVYRGRIGFVGCRRHAERAIAGELLSLWCRQIGGMNLATGAIVLSGHDRRKPCPERVFRCYAGRPDYTRNVRLTHILRRSLSLSRLAFSTPSPFRAFREARVGMVKLFEGAFAT